LEWGESRNIQPVRLAEYPEAQVMLTRYPPSSRFVTEELKTPVSFLTGIVKFRVASFHLDQEKVKGPVPPGLTAFNSPF
jgi:hypothetical protein